MSQETEEKNILRKIKNSSTGCTITELQGILDIPILPVIKRLQTKGLVRVDKPSPACPYTRFKATAKVFKD